MLLAITWDVDPDIFTILGREIRWYGLLWASALLCTAWIVHKMYRYEKLPEAWFEKLFLWVAIGLIIGARLGHCLFYDPVHYLSHPLELLKIWEGGLSSHGGAIGMLIAVCIYSWKITKRSFIWTLDRLIVGVGLGATLIRLGNLMNSEIYGMATTLPWGFNFVRDPMWSRPIEMGGSGALPCHPTQIYEALVYLAVFGLGMYLYWKKDAGVKQGLLLGISLIGIFLSRFLIEYIKYVQEEFEISMRADYGLDMGQLLSLPFIIWGVWLVWNALRKKEAPINKDKTTK